MLLPLFLLIEIAAAPAARANSPAATCESPAPDDARPYTLCLAETDFERAQARLQRQWAITLAHLRAHQGTTAARRLRDEQRRWVRRRDRECEDLAGASPVTQAGRNQMGCLAQLTDQRTAQLKALAKAK